MKIDRRYWQRFQNKSINNQYHLETLLGVGGYGAAFLAKEMVRNKIIRKLAIKLILPEEDEKKLEKQLEELDNAVNLSHPHLLHCYAPGECTIDEEEFLYLVMELAEESLDKRLKQGIISATETREIIKGLASALVYLHEERKQVHRDLKPANVLKVGENWKLSDFGLVCSLGMKTAIHSSNLKGTIRYVPPEAYDRGLISPAWDIWSLGVMITEMLTGNLPFAGKTETELMKAVLDYQISIDWDKLPIPFPEIINGCLIKEYKLRWTAQQVLDKLQIFPELVIENSPQILDKLSGKPENKTIKKEDIFSKNPPIIVNKLQPLETEEKTQTIEYPLQKESPILKKLPVKNEKPNFPLEKITEESQSCTDTLQLTPKYATFEFETVTVNDKGEIINRQSHQAKYFRENIDNNIFLDMVFISGGTFMMGSPDGEGFDTEKPQHQVTVKPFWMGKFAVTQVQWRAVAALPKVKIDLNPNPSDFKGANRPVENVSWHKAVEFCARLSQKTGKNYRLPSEAEWEYACRAGTTTPFYFGKTITTDLVNFNGDFNYASARKGIYRKKTTDVGSFPPNAFGLYDMHGNVWEWCADNWHNNYNNAPTDESIWQEDDNKYRIVHGGSWYSKPEICRAANRIKYDSEGRVGCCGFRIVFSP